MVVAFCTDKVRRFPGGYPLWLSFGGGGGGGASGTCYPDLLPLSLASWLNLSSEEVKGQEGHSTRGGSWAVLFAQPSAPSFPGTAVWPGTHCILTWVSGLVFRIGWILSMI